MKALIYLLLLFLLSCRAPRQETTCQHPAELVTCTDTQCRCLLCNTTWNNNQDSLCLRPRH